MQSQPVRRVRQKVIHKKIDQQNPAESALHDEAGHPKRTRRPAETQAS